MYRNRTVAIVVPAYNEERLISRVLETMPEFVDHIVVIDDHSEDATAEVVRKCQERLGDRLVQIRHEVNQGVGGAIATGYRWARDHEVDVTVVMAGDAQMDPEDLPALLDPVVEGLADYSKGNRLFTRDAWAKIPKTRYLGNSVLSLLTKIASGYWHVVDSQTGYTALGLAALARLDLDQIYKRYGVPNDILVRLNVLGCRVIDVPVRPVYNIGEASRMRVGRAMFTISWLLLRLFVWRIREKYVFRDFHPLVFFYLFAFTLLPLGFGLGLAVIRYNTPLFGPVAHRLELGWLILCALAILAGFQSLFFAMWFDMDYNRHLYVFDGGSRGRGSRHGV